jgi:hypothetical protein
VLFGAVAHITYVLPNKTAYKPTRRLLNQLLVKIKRQKAKKANNKFYAA